MSEHTWPDVLAGLVAGTDLEAAQTAWAMDQILSGEATAVQIAGFAVALRAKGETVDELQGLVDAMYEHATPLPVPGRVARRGGHRRRPLLLGEHLHDGGDRRRRGRGHRGQARQPVRLEQGRQRRCPRASRHPPGPAPAEVARVGAEAGITFCFAAAFHPALRHAATARSELGIGTTFNFLGPVANPAKPQAQAIGCADRRMAPVMAGVFARRGVDAWVFRGDDGLDELTTTTTSSLWAVTDGEVVEHTLDPAALGIPVGTAEGLRGQDVAYNADVVRRMLAGETGPVRDAVLLNAGAALAVHAAEPGSIDERVAAGLARATEAVDSGAAQTTLDRWVAATG